MTSHLLPSRLVAPHFANCPQPIVFPLVSFNLRIVSRLFPGSESITYRLSPVFDSTFKYRGELNIAEYLERTGDDVEDGEDLGDTTFEDGRTVFFGLQMITPV